MVPEKEFARPLGEGFDVLDLVEDEMFDALDQDLCGGAEMPLKDRALFMVLYRIHEDLQQIKRAIEQATTKD